MTAHDDRGRDVRDAPVVSWHPATGVVFTDAPTWPTGSFTPKDVVRLVPEQSAQAGEGEADRLRARDEAAKGVVQWWAAACDSEQSGEMRWDIPQEGREALDTLARAHGETR